MAMTNSKDVRVTLPTDRELTVARVFDAPRELVFDAFTKPEFVKRWLFGPDEWPMVHCEIDLRVGGALRQVWRHAKRGEMGMGGVYREVVPPKRLVHTELFDDDWTGGETTVTTLFEQRGDQTVVTMTVRYSSLEARDRALDTPMVEAWGQGYDRLDEVLRLLCTAI